jgi:hypothetical protein
LAEIGDVVFGDGCSVGSWQYFHPVCLEPGLIYRPSGISMRAENSGRWPGHQHRRVQRIGRSSPLDGQAAAKGLNVDTRIKQAPTNARHHSRTSAVPQAIVSPVPRSYTRNRT